MNNKSSVSEQGVPRVLVIVRGGVAEVFADPNVAVYMLDYDNEPEGSVPFDCVDLVVI